MLYGIEARGRGFPGPIGGENSRTLLSVTELSLALATLHVNSLVLECTVSLFLAGVLCGRLLHRGEHGLCAKQRAP